MANEAGFFRDEGLFAEVIRTAGPVAPMTLMSRDVDFSIMSGLLLVSAAVRERDLVMLGGFAPQASGLALISRPEIRNAEDLRGKTVGVQRPGDAIERQGRIALRHLGLDPDKDVKLLYLGSNELIWPALEGNRVAAAVIGPPRTLLARRAGMNVLVNLADLKIEFQSGIIGTRRSFTKRHPNLTLRTLRALARGVHHFKTRKEETIGILSKFFGTTDREALEETWGQYAPGIPTKPYAVPSSVQGVLNHLAESDARYVRYRPADFIDSGPLSALDGSGDIDRLYGPGGVSK